MRWSVARMEKTGVAGFTALSASGHVPFGLSLSQLTQAKGPDRPPACGEYCATTRCAAVLSASARSSPSASTKSASTS
eukprot:scaffold111470_cov31-Tisochrysis_lutea.AAC.6